MAIYRLLQNSEFGPEEIDRMTAAYEDALRVLRLANRSDAITDLVAEKIVEVAQTGERDANRIRDLALKALGVPPRDDGTRDRL